MDPGKVQALVTRFSLKDKRPRGAALAGPYVHAAMCVLACARIVFLMMFSLSVETWLATTQSVRDDISVDLFSMFENISLFFQIELA